MVEKNDYKDNQLVMVKQKKKKKNMIYVAF